MGTITHVSVKKKCVGEDTALDSKCQTECWKKQAALVPGGGRRLEDFAKVDWGLSKDFAVFTTTTTTSTTTTTTAPTPSKASYHVVDGSNCGQGLEIVSSEACKGAADALDITYTKENMKGKWKHTPPGCFVHKGCTQGCALHFGTGNGNNNGNFRAICNEAQKEGEEEEAEEKKKKKKKS